MKNFAAMTAWAIHTNTTPVFEGEQPLCRLLQAVPGRLQGLDTKHREGRLRHWRQVRREFAKIIEQNGLQHYDRLVMQEMAAQGREFGVENNPLHTFGEVTNANGYSFPVERKEFLFVTSPFGMRQDPMDGTKQQMHKGVDIRCNGDTVLATENGGKVIAVNHNKNTSGGKSLTVEYARADGSKVQCTYMHLREVSVKVGDLVQAGGRLGISGNTGTRTTGEHLHFGVANIYADGTRRDIDPAAYLAEIAQKGQLKQQCCIMAMTCLPNIRELKSCRLTRIFHPTDG